jgi:CPA1 family monovalent cation:H+ antiporter
MSELTALVVGVLLVLGTAAVVRVVAAHTRDVYYPLLLVLVGITVSILGAQPEFRLSAEMIRLVLLPTLLFQAAQETKSKAFWAVLPLALALTVVGLPIAVVLLGWAGSHVLGLPLVVTLLFAVIIYPIDPVAIIAVFREADASGRIAELAEAEGHLSEGFAIVSFGVVFGLVTERLGETEQLRGLVAFVDLVDVAVEITVVSVGGVAVGLTVGALAVVVLRAIRDRMAELLVTVVVPYASYLVAEQFHLSGVLGVVAAGLLIGTVAKNRAITRQHATFIEDIWNTAGFLVYTLVFVMIGVQAPYRRLAVNVPRILLAGLLVLAVRAVVVYGLLGAISLGPTRPVPRRYQHVLVWASIRTVIPIALLLLVPLEAPFREDLTVLVFGVAVLSIVVQGLLLPVALDFTGRGRGTTE